MPTSTNEEIAATTNHNMQDYHHYYPVGFNFQF
jgi:hypothetical protein